MKKKGKAEQTLQKLVPMLRQASTNYKAMQRHLS